MSRLEATEGAGPPPAALWAAPRPVVSAIFVPEFRFGSGTGTSTRAGHRSQVLVDDVPVEFPGGTPLLVWATHEAMGTLLSLLVSGQWSVPAGWQHLAR
jgi:hypothetical protein